MIISWYYNPPSKPNKSRDEQTQGDKKERHPQIVVSRVRNEPDNARADCISKQMYEKHGKTVCATSV